MKVFCFLFALLWVFNIAASQERTFFKKTPKSCQAADPKKNGIVKIDVNGKVFEVYCDVTTAGKGWLVIQRRVSPELNFFRNWTTYREGFGNLKNDFFIGLDKLYAISVAQPQQLYVHLEDFSGQKRYARYDRFAISNEAGAYALNLLGNYYGNAGDGLRNHQKMKFSTFDRDNDNSTTVNCAAKYEGGWWYNQCLHSNLNGAYLGGDYVGNDLVAKGNCWMQWRGMNYGYKTVQIMVKPA